MRRVASFVLLTLSLMTLGSAASAATPKEPKQQFVTFDPMALNGTHRSPGIGYFKGRQPAVFARMMSLRKDMTPGIFKATKDPVFK